MAHQEFSIAEDERTLLVVYPDQQRCGTRRREVLGLIFVAGSTLAMPTAAALAKFNGNAFPSSEIVFVRTIVQAGLALMGCLWIGIHPFGKPGIRKWVVFRGTVGAFALVLYYFGIVHLPLADVSVIINLHPMFAAVFASAFLKEPFGWFKRACALLCLAGTVLVTKPSFLFDHRGRDNQEGEEDSTRIIAILATLMAAMLSAIAYVTVRKVGQQAHFLNHTLSLGAMSAILASFNFHDFRQPQEKFQYATLGLIGVLAFVGQSLVNLGLQLVPAGTGTMVCMNEVVFASLLGALAFHEYSDLLSILGAVMIVAVSIALGWKS